MKLKQELIDKLQKGEIAVEHSHDLELLRLILTKTFPDDHYMVSGIHKYYYSIGGKFWDCNNKTSLICIKAEDFIEKYSGCIKDFPEYVVEAMLNEQEKQGNKRDVSVFEKSQARIQSKGGFDWEKTSQGEVFWKNVIMDNQFHLLKQKDMNRFPFKLSYENQKDIIKIACSNWKNELAEKWGVTIALELPTEVTEEFYLKMRKACTSEQNQLFDKIFGKDWTPKEGDWVTCIEGDYSGGKAGVGFKSGLTFKIKNLENTSNGICAFGARNGNGVYVNYIREATPEEIKKIDFPPDGTPCLVTSANYYGWNLRYSNGKGAFYDCGKKSGTANKWYDWKVLDINNLP